jgi:hypothetical protein
MNLYYQLSVLPVHAKYFGWINALRHTYYLVAREDYRWLYQYFERESMEFEFLDSSIGYLRSERREGWKDNSLGAVLFMVACENELFHPEKMSDMEVPCWGEENELST